MTINDQVKFVDQKSRIIFLLLDKILSIMLDKNKTIQDFEHFQDICNYFIQKLEGFAKDLNNV